jgi:hypothetical protein
MPSSLVAVDVLIQDSSVVLCGNSVRVVCTQVEYVNSTMGFGPTPNPTTNHTLAYLVHTSELVQELSVLDANHSLAFHRQYSFTYRI